VWVRLDDAVAALAAALNAQAGVVEALEGAYELYMHGNFENGVKDSTGTIDEGEVIASRIAEKIRAALAAVKGVDRG
jgi:hypothetical protein